MTDGLTCKYLHVPLWGNRLSSPLFRLQQDPPPHAFAPILIDSERLHKNKMGIRATHTNAGPSFGC